MARPKANTPEGIEATRKFRETMLRKYGEEGLREHYKNIGKKGGENGSGPDYYGGFAGNRERAAEAGRKGGIVSKRDNEFEEIWKIISAEATAMYDSGCSISEIATKYNIPYHKVQYRLRRKK